MHRRLPPLNSLRAFEAVARRLSFSRAAEELHLTQGAISRQIKALEEFLGITLFLRGNPLLLTEQGQEYLPLVQDALDVLDRVTAGVTQSVASPRICVRVPPTFAMRWLIPRLHTFQQEHPHLEVRLATSLGAALEEFDPRRNDIDIAIARVGVLKRDCGLRFDRLMDDEHVPICSSKLRADPHPLREPADLVHHTLLHASTRRYAWRAWLQVAGVNEVDPERGLVFEHYHFTLQAAMEGLGVAVAPRPLVADDLAAERLVIPFQVIAPSGTTYYLVYRSDKAENPAVKAFRRWILTEARPPRGRLKTRSALGLGRVKTLP